MAVPQDSVAPNIHYTAPRTPATRQRSGPALTQSQGGQAGQILSEYLADVRGMTRIANATAYRLYGELGRDPIPGVDVVRATGSALPLTWAPGDGDWRIGVTYFNGYLESGFVRVDKITIASGAQTNNGPANPQADWNLEQRAAGVVRINALYFGRPDGAAKATHWKIWYTVDGSTPDPTGAATASSTMTFIDPESEISLLAYDIPAQVHGTTINAIIRTYRTATTAYSANTEVKTTTADATGPAAPADIETWRGPMPEGL
jgi:hypothetical protein